MFKYERIYVRKDNIPVNSYYSLILIGPKGYNERGKCISKGKITLYKNKIYKLEEIQL